ncbi:PAS domain-containing sensor histidine kinase [Hymenobacter rigui]|nr:PAS domain-containing sensor histidine kinase [Hymenobacter rigui]
MADYFSHLPPGLPTDPTLLATLLNMLPMGVMYYTPIVDATGALTDLALAYLNPAAQRMTGLPAQPGTTYRQQFPTTDENGAWEFHRRSWLAREPQQFQFYYDADGFDSYFRVTGQHLGEGLLTVFTDTQDEVRSQAEQALLASQARERQRTQELAAAQAATERERALLQALLTQAPVAIALFQGEQLQVATVTTEMATIWGYTPTQVVGRPLLEGVPELRGQGFDDLLRQVLHTREPVMGTETPAQLLRDGQLHTSYYNFIYQPLIDAQGQILGVIDVSVDVTQQVLARRQVEQLNQELEVRVQERTRQLSEQQALLNRILGQVPASVATLHGPDHRYSFINEHYQQLVGNRVTLGQSVAEALPEAAEQGFVALLDQVYQTGEPYAGDETLLLLQQPTGPPTEHYLNFVYQPLRDDQGQVHGILAFAVEVTEQVLARRERETQRRELATLFEQAPAGVCILDGPEMVYSFANPAYQRILPGRELLGHSVLDALPELRGTEVETLLRQVYITGNTYQAQEQCIPVARADGSGELENRYFTLVYQARRDEHHRITGIFNLVVEVTEQLLARQQAEQSRQQVQVLNEELATINRELLTSNDELYASNTQLTRTNVDLDNFIYTASHDLKAPITNIEGLLLALEHELPAANRPGDVSLMLTMMQEAIERFQRTIVHLTDLSRLQKEHNPASAAVALAPVVEAVRLDIIPLLAQTRGQLTVSIPEGLTVIFAEKNLRSVVYNLLSNAFKYHHPDRVPVVQLRSGLADGYVVLEVQDNGLGLDLAQGQERLFGLFQRLHTHVEGTGIGLHMVKRMLENAGGRIEVSSQLGQGTTFRVYLRR